MTPETKSPPTYQGPRLSKLDLDLLSEREHAVLALAVEGCTDEAIARHLSIATSTVNSYWVRIRGKIGLLSRTEIVGAYLRRLGESEVSRLRSELAEMRLERDRLMTETALLRRAQSPGWGLDRGFDRAPVPLLVVCSSGVIVAANREANQRLRSKEGELAGAPFESLFEEFPATYHESLMDYFAQGAAPRLILGEEEPLWARRPEASRFRAVCAFGAAMEGEETTQGVATVRPLLEDALALARQFGLFGR